MTVILAHWKRNISTKYSFGKGQDRWGRPTGPVRSFALQDPQIGTHTFLHSGGEAPECGSPKDFLELDF